MDTQDSLDYPPGGKIIGEHGEFGEDHGKIYEKNLGNVGITLVDGEVLLFGRRLLDIIEKYGSPLKIFAPHIAKKRVGEMQELFQEAINWFSYKGKYVYTYCTKSNHFAFIVGEILSGSYYSLSNSAVHLETSSAFDAKIIDSIYIHPDTHIIHNGFKTGPYLEAIGRTSQRFKNAICVLDDSEEVEKLKKHVGKGYNVGIRLSTEDGEYNSRFGIPLSKVEDFVKEKTTDGTFGTQGFSLKMIHFFIETGIKDTPQYYMLLRKYVETYCAIYKICPTISALNIGGGMPVNYHLDEEIDYRKIVQYIVGTIQEVCDNYGVPHPDIFTEFGSYTVADTAMNVFEVIGDKNQNGDERWYIVDGSPMSMIPDSWAIKQHYPTLPINHLKKPKQKVSIGGITCDKDDVLLGKGGEKLSLPELQETPLFVGVLKTGAYQENIGGFGEGSLTHCQNSRYKVLVILEDGRTRVFYDGNDDKKRLETLGYSSPVFQKG